jgi:hypothetical protein
VAAIASRIAFLPPAVIGADPQLPIGALDEKDAEGSRRDLQALLAEEATRRIDELHAVLDDITSSQKLCEI